MEGISALAVGENGEVFVLMTEFFRGGTDLRVLDKNGKYLRTIMPYPANPPKQRLARSRNWKSRASGCRWSSTASAAPLSADQRHARSRTWPGSQRYLCHGQCPGTMPSRGRHGTCWPCTPRGAPDGVSFVGPQLRRGPAA